jgi:hypothetical protein
MPKGSKKPLPRGHTELPPGTEIRLHSVPDGPVIASAEIPSGGTPVMILAEELHDAEPQEQDDAWDILGLAQNWLEIKQRAKEDAAEEKDLNKQLSELVAEQGQADQKGHVWLQLPGNVRGWDSKGNELLVNAIQRQRRVSLVMDEDAALEILSTKKLVDKCSESWVMVTDTDKAIEALKAAGLLDGESGIEVKTDLNEKLVGDLLFTKEITEEEYDEIFQQKVTWALLPGSI